MYRALAVALLERGVDPGDDVAVAGVLPEIDISLRMTEAGRAEVLLAGAPVEPRIRTPEVTAATSKAAVHSAVRERMVALQRELAARHGGVIEGRDIGTRVVPDAPFKYFFDAPAAVRASRRLADLRAAGHPAAEEQVARELAERDQRDRSRVHSPLAPATDATLVDTSEAGVDELVARLLARIRGS
jgi:cytidylate kinase